jgi:hypothetical protein
MPIRQPIACSSRRLATTAWRCSIRPVMGDRSVSGMSQPQGVLYVPESNRLVVANGAGGRVDLLDTASLATVRRIGGMGDADNVRYDERMRVAWVGYGDGALHAMDPASGASRGEIALPGHPESFQLERSGDRAFVNAICTRRRDRHRAARSHRALRVHGVDAVCCGAGSGFGPCTRARLPHPLTAGATAAQSLGFGTVVATSAPIAVIVAIPKNTTRKVRSSSATIAVRSVAESWSRYSGPCCITVARSAPAPP